MSELSKKVPKSYVSVFAEQTVPAFAQAMRELFPIGTPHARLTAFFGDRASVDAMRKWRSGTRNPPPWAVEMVRAYHTRQIALLDRARVSQPGARGPENLRKMRAARLERQAQVLGNRD